MDGHLLPPLRHAHRPRELHPRPQLPRAAGALQVRGRGGGGAGPGAVGHLQVRHAPHPGHGDTHGAHPAAGQPRWQVHHTQARAPWSYHLMPGCGTTKVAGQQLVRGGVTTPARGCSSWWHGWPSHTSASAISSEDPRSMAETGKMISFSNLVKSLLTSEFTIKLKCGS